MAEYVVAAGIGLLAAESFLRLPILSNTRRIVLAMHGSIRVLRSTRLSDRDKQRFLLHYSWTSLSSTLMIALQIACALSVLAILWFAAAEAFHISRGTLIGVRLAAAMMPFSLGRLASRRARG